MQVQQAQWPDGGAGTAESPGKCSPVCCGHRRHQARGEAIPELRAPSPACRSLSARW